MDKKRIRLLVIVGVLFVLLAAYSEHINRKINGEGQILRNDPSDGSEFVDLKLNVGELIEDYDYSLKVPARKWTLAEASEYFAQAIKEIDATFCSDKETLDHVTQPVHMEKEYVDGKVRAEWLLDHYHVVDLEGNILESATTEEGTLVTADVELACGDYKEHYVFSFMVYAKEQSQSEALLSQIADHIHKEGDMEGKEYLSLPQELNGQKLFWSQKKEHLAIKVLFFEVIVGVLLFFVKAERAREQEKQKRKEMELDYAEMVNKLLILLGSGMSLKQSWKTISARYFDKRQKNEVRKRWIYEEMLTTSHEISDGQSERMAYEKFGERTGVGAYHRLVRILIQNLQTGSKGLCALLEKEAQSALEERRVFARTLGEEAATKMLLPLVMMLGIVIAIIMVPAMLSFNV